MYDSIEQIIAEKGIYTGLTRGTSMWPLIHQGRDNIIIVRPRGRAKESTMCRCIAPPAASTLCIVLCGCAQRIM